MVYLIIIVFILGLLLESVIVGYVFFVTLGEKAKKIKWLYLLPVVYFSAEEYIWYSIFKALDIKITIGNIEAIQILGRSALYGSFWSFDYVDIIILIVQSAIVCFYANYLYKKYKIKSIKPVSN
jgi:hypothetical protein